MRERSFPKNQEKQLQVLAEIIEKQLNVKQTEDRVVKLLETQVKKPKAKRKAFSKDTRIAMNTIRQSLTMVSDSGISLNTEEEEFDEYFQFTIKIPKNKEIALIFLMRLFIKVFRQKIQ